ncbi:MAG: ABC-2 family transporter protein [Parachlamydiaceae bacterium]|nr:ABC-2 family transporter protein [Parachlamydiaceae bacterium]
MMKNMFFFFSLLRTSIRASIHRRGAFLIESMLMITSNLIFYLIWYLFFLHFDTVKGWKIEDMIVLITIGSGGYGLMQICFGGTKKLSAAIINGDLDPFMVQPKNLLLHVIGSQSNAKGWGQLATSLIMIFLGGLYSPFDLLLILIGVISAGLVFTSMNVIAHSLPFWFGSMQTLAKKYGDALFLFALYPTNIYSGLLQIMMFTLIPAGIIGYLPVELIREFSWVKLLQLITAAATFTSIAFIVFYSGLKRYESGNQFGIRM